MSPNSWSESLNVFKWGQLSRTQPFEKFELKSDFTILSYLSKDGTTRDESGVGGVRQTGLNLLNFVGILFNYFYQFLYGI